MHAFDKRSLSICSILRDDMLHSSGSVNTRTRWWWCLFTLISVFVKAEIGRTSDEYIVVVKHQDAQTLQMHFEKISRSISDPSSRVNGKFPNLDRLNVHAYTTSNVELLEILQADSSVEYIEKISYFSVSDFDAPIKRDLLNSDTGNEAQYVIPDFAKTPFTTYQSADTACTIPYHTFRKIANFADDALPQSNTVVYLLDTGVAAAHPSLKGRVAESYDALAGALVEEGASIDPHGHGTYIAGLIAGAFHGVARRSKVASVRVMNETGWGSSVDILAGLEYLAGLLEHRKSLFNVVQLSFTGDRSVAVRDAIRALLDETIFVVAVGDTSSYGCLTTPVNIPDVLVVAGTDPFGDVVLPYSNFGECITLKAPGWLVSSGVPGGWGSDSPVSDGEYGLEIRKASSSGAAALVSGLLALLNDSLERVLSGKSTVSIKGPMKNRCLSNFIKNGTALHSLPYNDLTVHKYPYVPCLLMHEDEDWDAMTRRLESTVGSFSTSNYIFNHFERVRKQYLESSKHTS